MSDFKKLYHRVKNCITCREHLHNASQPILQVSLTAKITIVAQVPGNKAHKNICSWSDALGDKLKQWLNLPEAKFYDEKIISIMSFSFCYLGINKNGGDKTPRKEYAPKWHDVLISFMPNIKLILFIGSYAQKYYLKERAKKTVFMTVSCWEEYLPKSIPLLHPSWRHTNWLKRLV